MPWEIFAILFAIVWFVTGLVLAIAMDKHKGAAWCWLFFGPILLLIEIISLYN